MFDPTSGAGNTLTAGKHRDDSKGEDLLLGNKPEESLRGAG